MESMIGLSGNGRNCWQDVNRMVRLTVALVAIWEMSWGSLVIRGVCQTNVHSVTAAPEEFKRLMSKASTIGDVSATVSLFVAKTTRAFAYRFARSKELGLARIELVTPSARTVTYCLDKQKRRVCGRIGNDVFALDPEGTDKWLSIGDQFDAVMNTATPQARDVFFVGTEDVNGKKCKLFLFDQWGISTKLWVDPDDGVVYRKQTGDITWDFADVKVNTGLDREFLGGNIQYDGITVVSERELLKRLRQDAKQTP